MNQDTTIATLNNLIETCRDGEQGFRAAADGVTDLQVRALFQQYASQRARFVRDLQREVVKLGGTPDESGSVSGTLHRGWINIKSLVTGKDEQKIVAEAERGEDAAKAAFESARREPLPPATLALVERLGGQVREAHDRIRAMEKTGAR